jgi:hypothetical protein
LQSITDIQPEQIAENVKALDILAKYTPEIAARVEKILDNKPAPVANFGRMDADGKLT